MGVRGVHSQVKPYTIIIIIIISYNFSNFRVRAITDHFSYNARYENTKIKKIGIEEIPVTKGQFAEHFERKSWGYYIRTIGYTLDENGYQQFLIDLSTAKTRPHVSVISGGPGGPVGDKAPISSTALGSLIGGNSLG